MKNFDDVSCAFCGERNTQKDTHCSSCKNPLSIQQELLTQQVGSYTLDAYVARGFYGMTFKATDQMSGKPFALKLIPKKSYERYGKDFSAEVQLYGTIPDTPLVARYITAGEKTLQAAGQSVPFYYIVSEWVAGVPLKEFQLSNKLRSEHLIACARDLLSALDSLYSRNLWHNDLHDENILVKEISPPDMRLYRRTVPHMFVLVDVGSMVYRNPHDVKQSGDMTNTGSHLSHLCARLLLTPTAFTKEDQAFLSLSQDVTAKLMDETPSRAFGNPATALDQFERVYAVSRLGEQPIQKELDDPFGYVNANDIPSGWLLKHMFSEKFAYFRELSGMHDQCVLVTGPRGCGKTMILKNLRFTTQYDAKDGDARTFLDQLPHIGLFFSARTNFGNYLVSYRPQAWVKDDAKVVMYFNLLITVELLDVLYRLYFDKIAADSEIQPVLDVIDRSFSIGHANLLSMKHALVALSKRIINDAPVTPTNANSTPSYLVDLVHAFQTAIPALRAKTVVLLVDDLTWPRIPFEIQRFLLPILFNTGANYRTRITAHSDGLVRQDQAGEVYKENRDFRHFNLGYEYWNLSDNYDQCLAGFDDILSKRFLLLKRPLTGNGDAERRFTTDIGMETILSQGSGRDDIGREIHRLAKERKLRTLRYHGSRILVKLCSGDLSYLLDMLGKMHRLSKGAAYPIPIRIQHAVIRNYARNELRGLQDIRALKVKSLYDIAFYFGIWSKSKLVKHDADYMRIELAVEPLSEKASITQAELLCHGVFVDGGFSNMSDGGLARRLLFRRIYTPAFPTTFNNSDTFPMRNKSFCEFIENPQDFVRMKMSADGITPDEQQGMEQLEFDEETFLPNDPEELP